MKSFYVVLISLIMCSLMLAQDSTKHNWALSFGIGSNFTLTNFNMDIAVKKVIDDEHQLRLFLSPRISTKNEDGITTGSNQSNKRDHVEYSLGVGADYLCLLTKNEDINLFSGTGLILTYGNFKDKLTANSDNGNGSTDEYITEIDIPSLSVGVRGTIGVEWKVNEKIGIHSEYLLTGLYYWTKQEQKLSVNGVDNRTVTNKTNGISLGTSVLFGISIYL